MGVMVDSQWLRLAEACAIGLLIGVEREHNIELTQPAEPPSNSLRYRWRLGSRLALSRLGTRTGSNGYARQTVPMLCACRSFGSLDSRKQILAAAFAIALA
jgi:hypothetical protein